MGWKKRGKGHNSLTGHGAVMGPVTGKVLSFATRCKTCQVCEASKKMGKIAKKHDCRKNHTGSSKSMEREVACQLWCSAPDAKVKYSTYIGDDDSTTLADIRTKVPYHVEKYSDIIHAKRSLTTRLYNLKDRFKDPNCSILSSKVISYFSKCFSYAISQNVGDPENLKASLKCIVPHAFGNHTMCNVSWCGYKQSPSNYKHSDLPHGRDLQGEPLLKALTELLSEYATDVVVNKLSPGANSQRNESLNSTIASKNPKIRFYGGSESNDFRIACGVAQKNLGYNYVSRVLEALNIEPGHLCNSHGDAMDKKATKDRKRKSTKKFKYRRNQLHSQKSSQALRKEANEGTTYGTAVGLNLDPQIKPAPKPLADLDHLLENITDSEFKRYENLAPPYVTKPNQATLLFDPSKTYNFVVFDTETTCTGRNAELCQLSAIDETGLHIFSEYILPLGTVSYGASRVNKLSVRTINGKRILYKENQPVGTPSLEQALQKFLTFLGNVQYADKSESLTIMIGHNSSVFDTPILLRKSNADFHSELRKMNVSFADSQILIKHLIQEKHPALQVPSGDFCKSNQSSLYLQLFKEEFDAHDSFEDVKALRKILFKSPLQLNKEKIVQYSSVTSISQAVDSMLYFDRRHQILQTFDGKLFNSNGDNGMIKQSMALNIAGTGLSYENLSDLYEKFGTKGLLAILSMPPSQSTSKRPRVTRTKRILAAIAEHFDKTNPPRTDHCH